MKRDSLKRIGRPAKACMACGAPLDAIERHPSVLREELDASAAVEESEAGADEAKAAAPSDSEGASLREDYCPSCWGKLEAEGYFSFWLARRKPRRSLSAFVKKRRNATLLDLFEGSFREAESAPSAESASTSPETAGPFPDAAKVRQFILAHLLQRAQAVEHIGEREGADGRLWLVFTAPAFGDRQFEVEEQDPTNDEIEAVRAEILARLERQD